MHRQDTDLITHKRFCSLLLEKTVRKQPAVKGDLIELYVQADFLDLKEVVEHWKQTTHIMAKWFPEDNVEEKPKDFISKFLSGQE